MQSLRHFFLVTLTLFIIYLSVRQEGFGNNTTDVDKRRVWMATEASQFARQLCLDDYARQLKRATCGRNTTGCPQQRICVNIPAKPQCCQPQPRQCCQPEPKRECPLDEWDWLTTGKSQAKPGQEQQNPTRDQPKQGKRNRNNNNKTGSKTDKRIKLRSYGPYRPKTSDTVVVGLTRQMGRELLDKICHKCKKLQFQQQNQRLCRMACHSQDPEILGHLEKGREMGIKRTINLVCQYQNRDRGSTLTRQCVRKLKKQFDLLAKYKMQDAARKI